MSESDANETTPTTPEEAPAPAKKAAKRAPRKTAAQKAAPKAAQKAAQKAAESTGAEGGEAPAPTKRAPRKTAAKKAAAKATEAASAEAPESEAPPVAPPVLFQAPEKRAPRKRAAAKAQSRPDAGDQDSAEEPAPGTGPESGHETGPEAGPETPEPVKKATKKAAKKTSKKVAAKDAEAGPDTDGGEQESAEPVKKAAKKKPKKKSAGTSDETPEANGAESAAEQRGETQAQQADAGDGEDSADGGDGARRRPRRRGGRRRRRGGGGNGEGAESAEGADTESADQDQNGEEGEEGEGTSRRRRTRVRQPRNPEDEITSVNGSTRLEAKKQRRREGREAGRRRAPIVSEAEFLARRESVDRVMVIRQRDDLTQIGVLEDKVLVEHYVARESQTSLIGNIYLGRVQNVLPSMEAAFIDIGKGRNAVLYAGEVNWKALGHKDGQPRKIESVLTSGQTILVQVSKDPVGHKGARLTGQISLPGRFLVYVPDGTTSGISRKLPDTERNRLKTLLKEIVPETAGVIVRTAAEGASEDELTHDVERLTARWNDIEGKVAAGRAPELLYGEPDLTLKVVRDLFTEDFSKLVIQGDDAWDLVDGYVEHVAPDLRDRLERFEGEGKDIFATYRVDEQIAKGLDRKVWLPSGGSLIIDRTEAMTVVDVNTGKFTGSGGNLEETVTKNNLEAAEEIVRQLRLRDIGGIIVVDFIDMVLESNRDLVLRRLVECLGRDRTRHQVAEVTSLGLVQMTRKRIGTGLLEAFGEDCEHCKGRGVIVHDHPVDSGPKTDEPRGRRSRGGRSRGRGDDSAPQGPVEPPKPSPKDLAGSKPPAERPAEDEDGPTSVPEAHPNESAPQEPAAEAGPAKDVDAQAPAETRSETAPQTPAEDVHTPAVQQPEPVVAAPRVVTTTRRRAGRPAGPPAAEQTTEVLAEAAAPEQAPAEAPAAEPAADDSATGSVLHVPVKRKGARKR